MRRVKTGWVAQRANGQNWATDQGTADGIYVVGTAARAIFHLAGTVDAEAGPLFDIPTDPVLLRELATSLNELAAWKERGAWGKLHSQIEVGNWLDIKKEAAFHEAGHAVMAYLATYHGLVAGIDLKDYGAGEIYVGLIKSKCVSAGVPATAETAKLPEVAIDLGRVLVAGLLAELIAAERDESLTPDPNCARPDHDLMRQQLMNAGLSKKFDRLEVATRSTLEENWSAVDELAEFLLIHKSADISQIEAIIGPKLSCNN